MRTHVDRTTRTRGRPRWLTRTVAALATLVVAATGLAAAAAPAAAATVPITVTNPTITGDLTVGSWLRFAADWEVPDSTTIAAGDTFSIALPEPLRLVSTSPFSLTNDSGEVIATCTYDVGTAPETITCSFSAVMAGSEGASGDIWFRVLATDEVEEETLTIDIGGAPIVVEIPGGIGPAPGVNAPTEFEKHSSAEGTTGKMYWTIVIPASEATGTVTVHDELQISDPYLSHEFDPTSLYVSRYPVGADGVVNGPKERVAAVEPEGSEPVIPATSYSFTPADSPTVLDFSWDEWEDGYYYRIEYQTRADGVVLAGDKFANSAVVNTVEVNEVTTVHASGGGGGNGALYARFSVSKDVTGAAESAVPADTEFTVLATAGGVSQELTVLADGTSVTSQRFPVGVPIVISEIDLPELDGVEWGDYTVTGTGVEANADGTFTVTPAGGTTVQIVLENPADVPATPTPTEPPSAPPSAPPTTSSPSASPSVSPSVTPAAPSPSASSGGRLPSTGSSSTPVALGAALLLTLGGASVLVARRRTQRES